MIDEYSDYHHWFGIGVALRVTNDRFRVWCLRLAFGRRKFYIPVWPKTDRRVRESKLWN